MPTVIDGVEYKPNAAREAFQLEKFGTRPSELSPIAVLMTAESDMRARDFNHARYMERKRPKSEWGDIAFEPPKHYAFDEPHVLSAKNVVELLEIAIRNREHTLKPLEGELDARQLRQRVTAQSAALYRIYRDEGLLRAALELARARAA